VGEGEGEVEAEAEAEAEADIGPDTGTGTGTGTRTRTKFPTRSPSADMPPALHRSLPGSFSAAAASKRDALAVCSRWSDHPHRSRARV
jgi:hypothetical protein